MNRHRSPVRIWKPPSAACRAMPKPSRSTKKWRTRDRCRRAKRAGVQIAPIVQVVQNVLDRAWRLNGLNVLNLLGGSMLKPLALVAYILFSLTCASAQTPFYQGKTITIVQGTEPGGSSDVQTRALLPLLSLIHISEPTRLLSIS